LCERLAAQEYLFSAQKVNSQADGCTICRH